MKAATVVVYKFEGRDSEGNDFWKPLEPKDVPDFLKAPDNMGDLVAGAILEHEGAFYRGRKLADTKIVMHNQRAVMYRRPTIQ